MSSRNCLACAIYRMDSEMQPLTGKNKQNSEIVTLFFPDKPSKRGRLGAMTHFPQVL